MVSSLTAPQKFMMDKVRQDEVIIQSDLLLADSVYKLGKEGRTTDEILCWLWNEQYWEKYGLVPQAVNNFLTKRWLTKEVRDAIRQTPILQKVDEGIMKRIDMGSEKTLLFMKEKLDKNFQKADTTNITHIGKQITQINIQVVAPEEEPVLDITPE